MAERQGFTIYHSDLKSLSRFLNVEQIGKLMLAVGEYSETGELPAEIDPCIAGAMALLIPKIDDQRGKYEKTCERNRANRTSRDQSSPVVTSGDQWSKYESSRDQQKQELKQELELKQEQEQEHNRILADADGGEAANARTRVREYDPAEQPPEVDAYWDDAAAPDTNDGSMATCAKNVQVATQKPKVKAIRHKYGEYQNVLLTDEDYAKLQAEFPTEYESLIERLSAYMASTGRAYKNHLATMRNWAWRDLEKGTARSSPIPQAREAPPVYRQQTKAEELDDFYHMAAEWAAEASGGNDV